MSKALVVNDKKVLKIIQTTSGKKLNYAPFSSLYAQAIIDLDDASELDESLFMRTLEKAGVIVRLGGKVMPPKSIYDRMHGEGGAMRIDFYCKKNSVVAKKYTENFGVCLDMIEEFNEMYWDSIVSSLKELNTAIVEERGESDDWAENMRVKKGRGYWGEVNRKAKAMFDSGKASVVDRFFKKGK